MTHIEKTDTISSRNKFIIIIMLSGAFIAVLNQTVLSPALPSIMRDLQITASEGQWLTTAFMLVNGIMIPITAFLINRFTTRQIFLTAMLFFTLGTALAGFSNSFSVLLGARIAQAIGAGILMPMIQTVILLIFPISRRGSAMGMVGIVMAFAPAVGPTLAGGIVDIWGWNALFLGLAPIAALDIIVAFFLLRNVGETTKQILDIPSVIYSSLGFGGLLYGSSSVGSYGWASLMTIVPLIVGVVFLIIFTRRQFKLKEPLLELKILKNATFTYATIIGMIINAALISATIIMPIYLQNVLHFTALQSGLTMLPGAIIMGVMSPIAGNLFDRFGPRVLVITGLAIMTAGTACFIFMGRDWTFFYVCAIYTIRMFGMSMVMMTLTTWGLNSLDNRMIAHGSAINNTLRQVAGSIGTAALITVMTVATKRAEHQGFVTSTLSGMQATFLVATVLSGIALLLAIAVVKNKKEVEI